MIINRHSAYYRETIAPTNPLNWYMQEIPVDGAVKGTPYPANKLETLAFYAENGYTIFSPVDEEGEIHHCKGSLRKFSVTRIEQFFAKKELTKQKKLRNYRDIKGVLFRGHYSESPKWCFGRYDNPDTELNWIYFDLDLHPGDDQEIFYSNIQKLKVLSAQYGFDILWTSSPGNVINNTWHHGLYAFIRLDEPLKFSEGKAIWDNFCVHHELFKNADKRVLEHTYYSRHPVRYLFQFRVHVINPDTNELIYAKDHNYNPDTAIEVLHKEIAHYETIRPWMNWKELSSQWTPIKSEKVKAHIEKVQSYNSVSLESNDVICKLNSGYKFDNSNSSIAVYYRSLFNMGYDENTIRELLYDWATKVESSKTVDQLIKNIDHTLINFVPYPIKTNDVNLTEEEKEKLCSLIIPVFNGTLQQSRQRKAARTRQLQAEKKIFIFIAEHIKQRKYGLSSARIAKETKASKSTVTIVIQRLIDAGLIRVNRTQPSPDKRNHRASVFSLSRELMAELGWQDEFVENEKTNQPVDMIGSEYTKNLT